MCAPYCFWRYATPLGLFVNRRRPRWPNNKAQPREKSGSCVFRMHVTAHPLLSSRSPRRSMNPPALGGGRTPTRAPSRTSLPGASVRGSLPSVRCMIAMPTPSREPRGKGEEREKGKRIQDRGLRGVLGTTNSEVCSPSRRIVPAPERRTEIRRTMGPGAAPQDFVLTARWPLRILLWAG